MAPKWVARFRKAHQSRRWDNCASRSMRPPNRGPQKVMMVKSYDSASLEQLQQQILHRIDRIIGECEEAGRPLEIDPARSQLFELFVTAEGAGCVGEESQPDLSADGICQALADRWGLRAAARASIAEQSKLPRQQLSRMRSLWSVMRMWMEWTYAWQRWPEFHEASTKSD